MRSSRSGDRDHTVTLGTPPNILMALSSMTTTSHYGLMGSPDFRASSRDEICRQRGQAGNCCSAVYAKD
jgi:hypothetical protein